MPATRRPIPVERWTDPRHRLGLRGERLALAYLLARGWTLESHRFRFGRHDIDLVVRRGALVAFVEVKTRRTGAFGGGIEAVGWRKRQVLAKVAAVWSLRHGRPEDSYRFDLITILVRPNTPKIEHLENAWILR